MMILAVSRICGVHVDAMQHVWKVIFDVCIHAYVLCSIRFMPARRTDGSA